MTMSAKPRRGLGKGVMALLPDAVQDELFQGAGEPEPPRAPGVHFLPLDKIRVPEFQPRQDFDEKALKELAESIRKFGVLQPIVVRPQNDGTYLLIAGERRLRAARMAGLQTIPAFIKHDLPETKEIPDVVLSLIENLQREDLNPIEVAMTYNYLIEEYHLTHAQLAQLVGVTRSTITNTLRLLRLPPEIQSALRSGKLDTGHARALVSLQDPELQKRLAVKIIEEKLSVRQVEELVQEIQEARRQEARRKKKAPPDPEIVALQDRVRHAFPHYDARIERRTQKGRYWLRVGFPTREALEQFLDWLQKQGSPPLPSSPSER